MIFIYEYYYWNTIFFNELMKSSYLWHFYFLITYLQWSIIYFLSFAIKKYVIIVHKTFNK